MSPASPPGALRGRRTVLGQILGGRRTEVGVGVDHAMGRRFEKRTHVGRGHIGGERMDTG